LWTKTGFNGSIKLAKTYMFDKAKMPVSIIKEIHNKKAMPGRQEHNLLKVLFQQISLSPD
jgi:hypothetical protein